MTDLSHGQKRTTTLVLNVRTMAASPAGPPAPLQSPQPLAGRSPNVDPVMTEEQRSACPMSWLHSKDMPQCGYCILPARRYKAGVPAGSLQDAEDERLLQEEDLAGAFGKTRTWAVQHAGLSKTCSSADVTPAVPHPAALCSMVVTDEDRLAETAGTAVLNEGVGSSAAPQAQQLSQIPVDSNCPIQNDQTGNDVLMVEARRDNAPADHAPDSMPKGAPAKITATSRPEAPATADPAAAKPVPDAEEGLTNAETSPNLQAVPSPCNTSNRNDDNECALNDHCSCVKSTIQTYKDLKDSNATYQTTNEALNHVKELIAGFGVYSDPDLGELGLPPLDDPGGILPKYSQKHKENHAGIRYRQGRASTDPQGRYHEQGNINSAGIFLNAVLATEMNYTADKN